MDTAPDDKVAVMSMRAAAHQFGYLVGAAGGLAVGLVGFQGPASPRGTVRAGRRGQVSGSVEP
jgi:hypothetical protein